MADPAVDGDPPLTWSLEVTGDVTTRICGNCTRSNVRAIEAKLDQQWW